VKFDEFFLESPTLIAGWMHLAAILPKLATLFNSIFVKNV